MVAELVVVAFAGGGQVNRYPPFPPDSRMVAEPFGRPQVVFEMDTTCCKSTGWVMFARTVAVQLLASDTVTINCPAGKLGAVADIEPLDQLNEKGAVPPEMEAVAEPSFPEKQATFWIAEIETIGPGKLPI